MFPVVTRLHVFRLLFCAVLLLTGVSWLGYGVTQTGFAGILLGYGLAFAGYVGFLNYHTAADIRWGIGLAVLARLILLFAFPTLSDDIYRFVWDGRLLQAGLNPFDHLPGWYLEPGHSVVGLDEGLYRELNSPEYHTIYPPVAQAIFWLSTWLSPDSVYGSMLVIKLFLLMCELGSLYTMYRLMQKWDLPTQRILLYALNPLILVEIMGNLHFEGAMVCFLLLALWLLTRQRGHQSAGAMALSIASKLLPLLFLPFLLRRLRFPRPWLGWFVVLSVSLLVLFWPLLNGVFLQNFGESLDLYFRKFEFNASLYYLARWIGYFSRGYNEIAVIGPALAAVVAVLVFGKALFEKQPLTWRGLPGQWLFAIVVYLLCATTVHPWYLALPIVLCVFTTWRFPLVWSGLIVLTYVHYDGAAYAENYVLIAVEYLVVLGYLLWEVQLRLTDRRVGRV